MLPVPTPPPSLLANWAAQTASRHCRQAGHWIRRGEPACHGHRCRRCCQATNRPAQTGVEAGRKDRGDCANESAAAVYKRHTKEKKNAIMRMHTNDPWKKIN